MRTWNLMACWSLLAAVALGGCTVEPEQQETEAARKVLVFTKTAEFRHESIPKGIETMEELALEGGFEVVNSEDSTLFTDEVLSEFSAVVFLNTTGDILNAEQQVAFERYIQSGGGFVGIHSATDTEWKKEVSGSYWPWFQRIVGGVFDGHPESSDQVGELTVRDHDHLATENLPTHWEVSDEWYDFKRMPSGLNVLMTVDEGSYEGATMGAGEHHPVAWYREFDGGRSFYTALGHTESSYDNEHFRDLVLGGVKYAMGDSVSLDYSRSRPEAWRFTRNVLDSNLNEPLKLAFSPEDELYFIERGGALKKYDFEESESVTIHTFDDVYTFSEYGLLGLEFDLNFEENNWVYLYRTIEEGEAGKHVLARFRLKDSVLDEQSEQVLLSMPADGRPGREVNHTGGAMQFDDFGNLWLSTGDDTKASDVAPIDDRPGNENLDAARTAGNTQDLRGKILRITPRETANKDGRYYDIPEGNLFDSESDGRPEIYVMGVRNPYTIAYDSRQKTLYWGDIGPDARDPSERGPMGHDEVNVAKQAGNYGWPYAIADNRPYAHYDYENDKVLGKVNVKAPENNSRNNTGLKVLPPAQPAWIYYPYAQSEKFFELASGGRNALVAPVYYSEEVDQDSDIKFPSFYDGKLVISDFIRRWLMVVSTNDNGQPETIVPLVDQPLSAPLDMAFGPDGALYVVEYGSDWFKGNVDSYISRIEYYGGENPPPVAVAEASDSVGASPLETTLDASSSFDRGGDAGELEYLWRTYKDGSESEVIGRQKVQPYTIQEEGESFVELVVTDDEGQTDVARLRFEVGNAKPDVQVKVSGNRSFFWEGKPLEYEVIVEDKEDGSTQDGSISADEISIEKGYISGDQGVDEVLRKKSVNPVLAGRGLVTEELSCSACHGVNKPSIGPSFEDVADRYGDSPSGRDVVRSSISEGASGKWGGSHAMPAHPGLSEEQLDYINAFVFSLAEVSPGKDGVNLSGSLKFNQHNEDFVEIGQEPALIRSYPGVYFLSASYTDRGTENAAPLSDQEVLVLKHPMLTPGQFSDVEGLNRMEAAEGFRIAIVAAPQGASQMSYGVLKDIDLSGVDSVEVAVTTHGGRMAGGTLELRLDDLEAEAISSESVNDFVDDQSGFGVVSFDVSEFDGVHDIYMGAPLTEGQSGVLYVILFMEFKRSNQ